MNKERVATALPSYDGLRGVLWTWMRRRTFWFFLFIAQIGLLYAVVSWGYHTSRLPYWFDNIVQSSGAWQLFGPKEYSTVVGDSDYFLEPKLLGVNGLEVSRTTDGYVTSTDESFVRVGDASQGTTDITLPVDTAYYLRYRDGTNHLCPDCDLDYLNIGDRISVYEVFEVEGTMTETEANAVSVTKFVDVEN